MRIRSIKPEFFKHDGVASLRPLTRILFIGLWCLADCEGRLEDRPKRIRVEVLPYDDDADTEGMLNELHEAGMIVRYCVQGQRLIQVCSFRRHQRITGKEAESVSQFPAFVPKALGETTGKQLGSARETTETTGGETETETEGKGDGIGDGKETETRKPEKPAAVAAPTSDEEWLTFLSTNPAYQGIDVRREYAKAQAWCQTNNKQLSRRRFINWLNRCEKPMSVARQSTWQPTEAGAF